MFCSTLSENLQYSIDNSNSSTWTISIKETVWQYNRLNSSELPLSAIKQMDVIIDLSGVQRMSTAAFAQLVKIKSLLQQKGRRMVICGLQKQPQTLCELLKLSRLLCGESGHNRKSTNNPLAKNDYFPRRILPLVRIE